MASNAAQLRAARAGAAVDDQILGTLGDLGIEIVHQHPQRGFLRPALAGERRAARRANDATEQSMVIGDATEVREKARCEDKKLSSACCACQSEIEQTSFEIT